MVQQQQLTITQVETGKDVGADPAMRAAGDLGLACAKYVETVDPSLKIFTLGIKITVLPNQAILVHEIEVMKGVK